MEFTTRFGLHSQTSRLAGARLQDDSERDQATDGIVTLYDAAFQRTLTRRRPPNTHHQTTRRDGRVWPPDFKFELFPLHSPLLGESRLVSFPPLIDMLKFSG